MKNTTAKQSKAAATLGRIKSGTKTETARENGRKGGRPRQPWLAREISRDSNTGRCYRVLLARGREQLEVYLDCTYHTSRHGKVTPWEPDESTTPISLFCWKQEHERDGVEANHRDFLDSVVAGQDIVRGIEDPLGLLVEVDRSAIDAELAPLDMRG